MKTEYIKQGGEGEEDVAELRNWEPVTMGTEQRMGNKLLIDYYPFPVPYFPFLISHFPLLLSRCSVSSLFHRQGRIAAFNKPLSPGLTGINHVFIKHFISLIFLLDRTKIGKF